MGLLAAWQALLGWWCGQDEVIVGVPAANRADRELADTVGFLVNSLPIRTRLPADARFADLVAAVRATTLAAYANHEVPFDRIVEELRPQRRAAESAPVFRAWFVLHDLSAPAWDLPGVAAAPLDARFLLAVHDIKLSLAPGDDGLEGGIDYRTSLFDPATVERLCDCLLALLEAVAAEPEVTLSALAGVLDAAWRPLRPPPPAATATTPGGRLRRAQPVIARSPTDVH
jgi:non-ribosomal peptide synthetase component F